ncbi:MAG: hypothetical protein J7L23_00390 [Candidatus Diapherotrites archaeon]|nr:hypothetical protein [Candidatus Diapherotrites archaeon]
MPLQKSQLDTIEIYLRTMVSKEKAADLMKKVIDLDEEKAEEMIVFFEKRANPRLQDVERFLKKQ